MSAKEPYLVRDGAKGPKDTGKEYFKKRNQALKIPCPECTRPMHFNSSVCAQCRWKDSPSREQIAILWRKNHTCSEIADQLNSHTSTIHSAIRSMRKQGHDLTKRCHIRDGDGRKAKEEVLADWLKENPCCDCGETDILCLECDHIKGRKKDDISQMLDRSSWTVKDISSELEKCESVCVNCHRLREATRGRAGARIKLYKKTKFRFFYPGNTVVVGTTRCADG